MVKFDLIEPSSQGEGTNKGQSIAAKSRVVAANDGIKATFDLDLLGLKNLAVDEPQKKFLLALALWKIGALLSNKASFDARSRQTSPALRLRADCYLSCVETVKWSGSKTPVRVTDLLVSLADQTVKFEDLAKEQGFTLKTESKDGPRLIPVTYREDRRRADCMPTPAPEPPTSEEPQVTES